MAVLGILSCQVLELELAHLLATDQELTRVTVLTDEYSEGLCQALELEGRTVKRLDSPAEFQPGGQGVEALVRILEIGLHTHKKALQGGIGQGATELGPHVDALLLGYGLCGNALEDPESLLAPAGAPVFLPMDGDHPVDDCVGLLLGGREAYYEEQCKCAGTFFLTAGWARHWKTMATRLTGDPQMDSFKKYLEMADYSRSLQIPCVGMSPQELDQRAAEFNQIFGLTSEVRPGTLELWQAAWQRAKDHLAQIGD
jgi:uncharacterized protein DUF1638